MIRVVCPNCSGITLHAREDPQDQCTESSYVQLSDTHKSVKQQQSEHVGEKKKTLHLYSLTILCCKVAHGVSFNDVWF